MISLELQTSYNETTPKMDLNKRDLENLDLFPSKEVSSGSLYRILMTVKRLSLDRIKNKLRLFYCYVKENDLSLLSTNASSNEESFKFNLTNENAFFDPCFMDAVALLFKLRVILYLKQDSKLKKIYFGKEGNKKVALGVMEDKFILLKKNKKRKSLRKKKNRSSSETTQQSLQFKSDITSLDNLKKIEAESLNSKKIQSNDVIHSKSEQNKKEHFQDKIVHLNEEFMMGRLKFFNKKENYGFITDFNGKDIFLHGQDLIQQDIDMEQLNKIRFRYNILVCFKQLTYKSNSGSLNYKAVEARILSIQY